MNVACPCWSGYHFLHTDPCGCKSCDPEKETDER